MHETAEIGRSKNFGAPQLSPRAALGAMGAVSATTVVCFVADPWLPIANIVVSHLIAVLLVAIYLGRSASIIAAVVSFLAINFFFTEPRFSFAIADAHNVLTVFFFLAAAFIASDLAARLNAQVIATRQHAERIENLFNFNRKLMAASGLSATMAVISEHVGATMGGGAAVLTPQNEKLTVSAAAPAGSEIDPASMDAAEWAWRNREIAGCGAPTAPAAAWLFLPLRVAHGALGALGVRVGGGAPPSAETRRLLQALADQAAVAIERATLAASVEAARVAADRERLRAALLLSLSHDLRTPLSSILGAASSLHLYGDAVDAAARRELAQSIQEEAERLNRFVQNLLDMTRIGSGDLKPRADWVDPTDVLNAALARSRSSLLGRAVHLALDPALPLIYADPLLLEQVFVNLIDNACKYAPAGTAVALHARPIDGQIEFAVCDAGPGVPLADRQRVFDMFYRVEAGDARPAGAGLGLTICRGVIEAHGGVIEASDNDQGGGACMVIRMPIPAEPATVDGDDADEDGRP